MQLTLGAEIRPAPGQLGKPHPKKRTRRHERLFDTIGYRSAGRHGSREILVHRVDQAARHRVSRAPTRTP
jgi:hypothetical protein